MKAKRGTHWQDLLGTVAFFPSKVVERHKNPDPLGPAHVPAPLLQMQAAADAAPAAPQLRQSAPPRALTTPGGRAQPAEHPTPLPWRAAAEPEGKGGAAPVRRRLSPTSPDREESPTCQEWRSERVRPTIPSQRPGLLSPAFQRTSNVTSSTETFRHKTHSRGEGLHHRHTH